MSCTFLQTDYACWNALIGERCTQLQAGHRLRKHEQYLEDVCPEVALIDQRDGLQPTSWPVGTVICFGSAAWPGLASPKHFQREEKPRSWGARCTVPRRRKQQSLECELSKEQEATIGAPGHTTRSKKLLGARTLDSTRFTKHVFSSFLLLVVWPGAPSSSDARSPDRSFLFLVQGCSTRFTKTVWVPPPFHPASSVHLRNNI